MNSARSETERIREAFLQAAEGDFLQAVGTEEDPVTFSLPYQRWEARFLKNPRAFARRLARPLWQRAARAAVCFLLVAALSFGCLMWASPQARAVVIRWSAEWFDTHVSYNFTGASPDDQLGLWEPAYLPEGYQEGELIDLDLMVRRFYQTNDPEMFLEFSYEWLTEGGGESLDNEHHVISDITVNGIPGQLFTATDNSPNVLIWFDETSSRSFLLISRLPCETLMEIAESVHQVE